MAALKSKIGCGENFVCARNPKFEIRDPKEIRSPKPEGFRVGPWLPEHWFLPDTTADFGLRNSNFFRFSGSRISEFRSSPIARPVQKKGTLKNQRAFSKSRPKNYFVPRIASL